MRSRESRTAANRVGRPSAMTLSLVYFQPFSDGQHNRQVEEGDELTRDAFGNSYTLLAIVKNRYELCNMSRFNQNIRSS
jgi:hypothetical protein